MTEPTPEPPSRPPLRRSSSDRVLSGVCGGLATHLGIDAALVRIAMVVLVLLGGAGLVAYAVALVVMPREDGEAEAPPRERALLVGLVAVLVVAGVALGGFGFFWGFGLLAFVGVLMLAGLLAWWVASGTRPEGDARSIVQRAAQGLAVLVVCGVLAAASFLASAFGGGAAVAAVVVAAGVGLVGLALRGKGRWLVLPALAVAVPAVFVAAVGLDLEGGTGKERYTPTTAADVRPSYRLGAGELIVDLRRARLTPGDHRVSVHLGAGHALVIVPAGVCVSSEASVGMGQVDVLEHGSGGIDVDWDDPRRAPASTPRLVLDGDIGLGYLEVSHRDDTGRHGRGWDHDDDDDASRGTNTACLGGRV